MSTIAGVCCSIVNLTSNCRVPKMLDAPISRLAIAIIRGYQRFLSLRTGTCCLFSPSCSHRSVGYFQARGFNEGIKLVQMQLERCGGNYTLSKTASGETWLKTADGLEFGPGEISNKVSFR